jgi:molecular chaperone DnaK
LAEARNKGQHLVYQLEKQMKENADKLTDNDRAPLNAAIDKVKTAIDGTDVEAIKSATSELEQAAQAFGKILYEKAGAAGAGAAGGQAEPQETAQSSDDDAIDAEFEVKND